MIVVEPSQYIFNRNKYISRTRMKAVIAKQCLWSICVTNMTLKQDCF